MDNNVQNSKNMLKQTIILALFFLILTTTYSSFSYIVTYIYENEPGYYKQLGPVMLFANYATFLITNTFAASIKLSFKKQFIIASTCYTINYLIEIIQLKGAIGIIASSVGAILGGFGAGIVWVSQGGYMTSLFTKFDIGNSRKGHYFGVLNGIVFANNILGALITTFCIGFFSYRIYFIILSIIGGLSLLYSIFLIKDIPKSQSINTVLVEQSSINEQFTEEEVKKEHSSIIVNIQYYLKNTLSYVLKMKIIITMLILDGLILGFISASSTYLLPDKSKDNLNAGIFLILVGLGSVIGGFTSGPLSDYIKLNYVGQFALVCTMFSASLSLFILNGSNFGISLFCGFVWGFTLYMLQGWLLVVCSKTYSGSLQSFAVNKLLHSSSFCLFQIYLIIINGNIHLEQILILIIVLGTISFLILIPFSLQIKEKSRKSSDQFSVEQGQ